MQTQTNFKLKDFIYIFGIASSIFSNFYSSYIYKQRLQTIEDSYTKLLDSFKNFQMLSNHNIELLKLNMSHQNAMLAEKMSSGSAILSGKVESTAALLNEKVETSKSIYSIFGRSQQGSADWQIFLYNNAGTIVVTIVVLGGLWYGYYYYIKPVKAFIWPYFGYFYDKGGDTLKGKGVEGTTSTADLNLTGPTVAAFAPAPSSSLSDTNIALGGVSSLNSRAQAEDTFVAYSTKALPKTTSEGTYLTFKIDGEEKVLSVFNQTIVDTGPYIGLDDRVSSNPLIQLGETPWYQSDFKLSVEDINLAVKDL